MKKIFGVILLASVLMVASGVASASTTSSAPINGLVGLNADQKACIKTAQDARTATLKTAMTTMNDATKDALKTRQDAIKKATDTLNTTTKDALKIEQSAIASAQKNKDVKARSEAIKAANDAYSSDKTVIKAKVPYMAAIKAANDAYNKDTSVTATKPAFAAAVKAANDKFQIDQKACLGAKGNTTASFFKNIFSKAGNAISNSLSRVMKFFSGKK